MADNTGKGMLKSTAEVVATTSTILVAGKTIASVIDSTASSVKGLYAAESASVQEAEDVVSTEIPHDNKTNINVQNTKSHETVIHKSAIQGNHKNEHDNVKDELYNIKEAGNEDIVCEPIEEITDNDDVSILSTEPLDGDIPQEVVSGECGIVEENLLFCHKEESGSLGCNAGEYWSGSEGLVDSPLNDEDTPTPVTIEDFLA